MREMNISIKGKTIIASALSSIGIVSRIIKNKGSGAFLILMYHRILPREDAKDIVQAGMFVEPSTFNNHILFLKMNFKIVSLEAICFSKERAEPGYKQPTCVLTFDDGWSDFYSYAFPILQEHEVPATVFLPTDYIGSADVFWMDQIAFLIREKMGANGFSKNINNSYNQIVKQIENMKGPAESMLERVINLLKGYHEDSIREVIKELHNRWNIDVGVKKREFLSWDEVREMAESNLVSYGSHTASHRILTALGEDEIFDELVRSRERLIAERVVDQSFIPLSYPNGNFNENIAQTVKETGYSLAVTTVKGWNNAPSSDPYSLRRIGIHQDMSSTRAMLACRVAGFF